VFVRVTGRHKDGTPVTATASIFGICIQDSSQNISTCYQYKPDCTIAGSPQLGTGQLSDNDCYQVRTAQALGVVSIVASFFAACLTGAWCCRSAGAQAFLDALNVLFVYPVVLLFEILATICAAVALSIFDADIMPSGYSHGYSFGLTLAGCVLVALDCVVIFGFLLYLLVPEKFSCVGELCESCRRRNAQFY